MFTAARLAQESNAHALWIARAMARNDLSPLAPEDLPRLEAICAPRSVRGGSLLMRSGEDADRVFVAREVRGRVLDLVGAMLEVSPADLEIVDGTVSVRGAPAKAVPLAQVAMGCYLAPSAMPPGISPTWRQAPSTTARGAAGRRAPTSAGWRSTRTPGRSASPGSWSSRTAAR